MLYATYINTKENVIADRLCRTKVDFSDFMLSKYFSKICRQFMSLSIDLFASYQTKQCEKYVSWKPDPYSAAIDAFTIVWPNNFYAFPPFNLAGRTINKIISDRVKGIVVAPNWSTQLWFPMFQKLSVSNMLIIGPNKKLLYNPYSRSFHQINPSLQLMIGVLSGKQWQD